MTPVAIHALGSQTTHATTEEELSKTGRLIRPLCGHGFERNVARTNRGLDDVDCKRCLHVIERQEIAA
jgi:hypothetical protein